MAQPLGANTRLVPAEDVVLGDLPDETVLLSVTTGAAVRLNPTGGWLWGLLESSPTAGDLAGRLAEQHGIDHDRALADVRSFAEDLASRNFLELR